MSRIKCIIVDDPYSASILEVYIAELSTLERSGTFSNPVDALMFLQHSNVDLLFINTQLRGTTGTDFLKLVPGRPKVIFLVEQGKRWTGEEDDQVLGAISKPLQYEEFLNIVYQCHRCIPPKQRKASPTDDYRDQRTGERFIYFHSGKALIKVLLKDILYIESIKTKARITTTDQSIIVGHGLTDIQAKLPEADFLRIHRSLIVSINKVVAFNDYSVEINHCILPVAEQYHGKVMKLLRLAWKDT